MKLVVSLFMKLAILYMELVMLFVIVNKSRAVRGRNVCYVTLKSENA